jgi:hypothetical protein
MPRLSGNGCGLVYPMDVLLFEFILGCQLPDGVPGDILESGR